MTDKSNVRVVNMYKYGKVTEETGGNIQLPKYDEIDPYVATRGVIGDEWVGGEQLDMYELAAGVKATGLDRLNTIFFHNCLMGNIETLSELRNMTPPGIPYGNIRYSL